MGVTYLPCVRKCYYHATTARLVGETNGLRLMAPRIDWQVYKYYVPPCIHPHQTSQWTRSHKSSTFWSTSLAGVNNWVAITMPNWSNCAWEGFTPFYFRFLCRVKVLLSIPSFLIYLVNLKTDVNDTDFFGFILLQKYKQIMLSSDKNWSTVLKIGTNTLLIFTPTGVRRIIINLVNG